MFDLRVVGLDESGFPAVEATLVVRELVQASPVLDPDSFYPAGYVAVTDPDVELRDVFTGNGWVLDAVYPHGLRVWWEPVSVTASVSG